MATPTRRELLAGVGSAALLPGSLGAQGLERPPATRVVPVTTSYFGTAVADPYRWMENTAAAEWQTWLKAQAVYADGVLAALPRRSEMLAAITHYAAEVEAFGQLSVAGDTLFITRRPKGARSHQFFVRPIAGGPERLLLDPAAIRDSKGRSMGVADAAASPDGRRLAVSLIPDGAEDDAAVHVFDVATGARIGSPASGSRFNGISWLPDGSGFFYSRLARAHLRGDVHFYDDPVCVLRMLDGGTADRVVLKSGDVAGLAHNPLEIPYVISPASSPWVLGAYVINGRYDGPFFIARREALIAGTPDWRMVSTTEDHVEAFALVGDRLYLKGRGTASTFEVRMATADRPAWAKARVVVPRSDMLISDLVASSEGIWVLGMRAGRGELRFLSPEGRIEQVALPPDGSLWGVFAQPTRPELWLGLEDFTVSSRAYRMAGRGRPAVPERVIEPYPYDLSGYHVERVTVTARDGARVPLDLVKRRSLSRDGRAPVLLEAYGAYGHSMEAYFDPQIFAFLDRGGIYAVAHVRGGGEFGEDWHRAGQKSTKPNTWRDAIDCGEWLVRERWSAKGRLAVWGTSAGGIMVGRAITERPDLWGAAIDRVGISDTVRVELTQNGPSNIGEFGTATKPDEFRWLLQMSPYHAVRDGVAYPAVMLMTGANDARVEPWQLGKMTARLQAATNSAKPVILRVDYQAGHGAGLSAEQRNRELADMFAFVLANTAV